MEYEYLDWIYNIIFDYIIEWIETYFHLSLPIQQELNWFIHLMASIWYHYLNQILSCSRFSRTPDRYSLLQFALGCLRIQFMLLIYLNFFTYSLIHFSLFCIHFLNFVFFSSFKFHTNFHSNPTILSLIYK